MKVYKYSIKNISFLLISFLLINLQFNISLAQEREGEETYSITLVQTAEVDKEIITIDEKKVLTEAITVEKGDHVWQLFRERGLLKKRNLRQLLSMLQKLNKSLTNLDLIYPDQRIVIPLVITPIGLEPRLAKKKPKITISPELLRDLEVENYTIKPGDTLVKILKNRYPIPDKELYDPYLQLLRGLNPSIEDLDRVYPGQVVRIPIWSPQIVRVPIRPATSLKPEAKAQRAGLYALSHKLGHIFAQMGEEWAQSGEHFIPLKSGGHLNLRADSFPIINLYNGRRIIVDLYSDLPERITKLIESNWENYEIVRLNSDDDLRTAFNRILSACDYKKIYAVGEPFELGGEIPLRLTGDWIIKPTSGPSGENEKMVMITLLEGTTARTPQTIKDFLLRLGIKAIDYPPGKETPKGSAEKMKMLRGGNDRSSLIETLLTLTGQQFSSQVKIPFYKREKTQFNLVIKADFLLNVNGKHCIIDLTGLDRDIVALLEEHQFSVLSLVEEKDLSTLVSKTLDFLGVKFDSKSHNFMATERDESRNIRLTIPGIIFRDNNGRNILATRLKIPGEIATFLSQRGYRVLSLTLS